MAQLGSKASTKPGWSKMGPPGALLATWDIPLRIFAHFYEVFANNCAFLLKINEKLRKSQKNALKSTNFTEKVLKCAQKWRNDRQK